jgi:hypothetical protein
MSMTSRTPPRPSNDNKVAAFACFVAAVLAALGAVALVQKPDSSAFAVASLTLVSPAMAGCGFILWRKK